MSSSRRNTRTSGDLVMAPRVPHGLAAAVEGLTREVIRHRPEDIYVFAAQHFEELLKLRDEYGAVTNLPGRSTNTAALREMNQSLKKRNSNDNKKWSMNDTARVLERHRSIFGDRGKKVTPEEVRALGEYGKENKSKRKEDIERFINNNEKRRGSNEKFVRRKLPARDQDAKSKSDSNGNPKIISQIPTTAGVLLAKDIKSELRKNRNSIRERTEKKTSERTERRDAARVSGNGRNNHEKLIGLENLNDNQNRKTESFSRMPRTLSMDRVREYVMEKFRSSESCEELISTNYVDKVQEVIDEASPSILKKVKELSTRSAGRCRGYESVDESTSTSTRSDKSNQTEDLRSQSAASALASRKSRRSSRRSISKSKSKVISCADSLEGIETLASETELFKTEKKNNLSVDSDVSDNPDVLRKVSAASSISLPAVRPPSSRNQSRSVSRSDSDNFVLPPIPSEGNKSAKLREELVLPSLKITKDVFKAVETSAENDLRNDNAEVLLNLPDPPTDEIFKDSLNVSPDMNVTPRPDSLEPNDGDLRNYEIDSGMKRGNGDEEIFGNGAAENPDAVSIKDKLIELQEAEKILSDILDPRTKEIQENMGDIKIKEKLIEIEETEKRIEKIFDPETTGGATDTRIKEKLIEIEETEKRIEKILDTEPEKVEKGVGIKERLMEIEDTEKRIEKIFDTDVETERTDVGFMREKLMEIEEAEKRLENVFHANSGEEKKLEEPAEDNKSVPKTPFIPEIPSEFVVSVNEVNVNEQETEDDENNQENIKPNESDSKAEQFLSGTPDSLGNSYVLTEGSPYDIPESVTTVIIPERMIDTPSSEVFEIVVEEKGEKNGVKDREISLRNILDNFGEIVVQQETTTGSPSQDVDFIKNFKTLNEVVIDKKDLGLITEEEDKDIGENDDDGIVRDILLQDIVETEEIPETDEAQSFDELSKNVEKLEDGETRERKKRSLENLEPELQSPTTTLQHNATESTTTESTDEVKETTISDDGGNTAAESSVTLPSCGEEMGVRNSESSNEVKETTISDQPANQTGKNLFSLVPQCYGSMPHVPELNLDSLQDITVSSFQLSDDASVEEEQEEEGDSDVAQPQSSNNTVSEVTHDSQANKEVNEEIIVKEQVPVKEDPCVKEILYVTEPVTQNVDVGAEEIHVNQETEKIVGEDVEIVPERIEEKANDKVLEEELEEQSGNMADERPEKVIAMVDKIVSVEEPEEADKKLPDEKAKIEPEKHFAVAEEEPEKLLVDEARTTPEQNLEVQLQEVHEAAGKKGSDKDPENLVTQEEEETEAEPEEKVEIKLQKVDGELAGEKYEEGSEKLVEEMVETDREETQEKVVGKVIKEEHSENVPEEKSEKLVEKVTGIEVQEVFEKKPEELVHEELVQKLPGEIAENVPLEKSEKVDEEVSKTEVDKVLEEKPEEVPEEIPRNVALEKSEKLDEEVSKTEIDDVFGEKPDQFHEELVQEVPEEIAENASGEESGELVEEVTGTGVGKVFEEKSEKVHEEHIQKVPEELAGSVPEETPAKFVEGMVESKLVKNEDEICEKIVHEIPEEKSGKEDRDEAETEHEGKDEGVLGDLIEKEIQVQLIEKVPEEHSGDMTENLSNENSEVSRSNEIKIEPEENHEEEKLEELSAESVAALNKEENTENSASKYPEEEKSDVLVVGETNPNENKNDVKKIDSVEHLAMRVPPQVSSTGLTKPEAVEEGEEINSFLPSNSNDDKIGDIKASNLKPPKAEVVTNDLERTEYHIYVPELTASQDYSTTESSTFNSAATKIQAGVRGFLTRRRLQSAQRRSSTLDSVPSIQDSIAADVPHLEPIEEVGLAQAATTIQSSYRGYKARQRLRREDAVQKTTMSGDNLFCGNGIQHTGEFHDCIPLPLLQDHNLKLKNSNDHKKNENNQPHSQESNLTTDDQESLGLLGQNHYPFPLHQALNVVVLTGNDAVLQSQYLNFITSIEEVHNEQESIGEKNQNVDNIGETFFTMKSNAGIESLPLDNSLQNSNVSLREPLAVPGTPTTLIIEELSKTDDGSIRVDNKEDQGQSLDLPGLSLEPDKNDNEFTKREDANNSSLHPADASLGTMSFSMNVDDMLGLGGESDHDLHGVTSSSDNKMKPILEVTVTPRDLLKLTNRSQVSQVSADRVESPVTMMQIVPKSVEDKSDRSEDDGFKVKENKESHEEDKSVGKN